VTSPIVSLAKSLISVDTRSRFSNLPLVELLEEELFDFEIERVSYLDRNGVKKAALAARRGPANAPCLGLSGHLDTVPPTGWSRDPFVPEVEGGRLFGLGATDMKGPVAAAIHAARRAPKDVAVLLLLTSDEEWTKEGARRLVDESELLKASKPAGIVVVEPTGLIPVRGHRVDIQFVAEARGVQAHSSTAEGRNANIHLIPFLSDMRELHLELREKPQHRDDAYLPPWCDLNITVDNHGAAPNVTVGLATCRMKLRYSKRVDPEWIVERVQGSAARHGLGLSIQREAPPPELPADHPLVSTVAAIAGNPPEVVGFGTDASELSRAAPCVIFGPGDIGDAHTPDESIDVDELDRAGELLVDLLRQTQRLSTLDART
jgi:acetylornithine deacetylase